MSEEVIASLIGGGFSILVPLTIFLLSKRYYDHTKNLEKSRMMKELFMEFNKRFDIINADLDAISRLEISAAQLNLLDSEHRKYYGIIIDFFNLCAEEYYWNEKEYLDEKIWLSWEIGMNIIYNRSKLIQGIWDDECLNEGYKSYYIDKPNSFFRKN